jgi:hypothetical protein
MSPPGRSFRLFDAKKYEEIQPVVEEIYSRTASNEQAISLINKALNIVETDDFEKKNSSMCAAKMFRETITLVEYLGLPAWPGAWRSSDPLGTIIHVICCPNYRELGYSEIFVDYTECFGLVDSFTKGLQDSLHNSTSIPSDCLDMSIYGLNALATITKIMSTIDPRVIAGSLDPRHRPMAMTFYTDLSCLIRLANSQPHYTILYESD